jgi:hypothetical protein
MERIDETEVFTRFCSGCSRPGRACRGQRSHALHYLDFTTDQEYGLISGQMILDVDGSGNVTDGSASMHGAGLTGVVNFSVVTTDNYPCCGPTYSSTGWRAGDGTDLFGFDTSYPIDTNGLVFHSGASGTGYVFGVYSDGAGGYQNALFGPGGAGNFYSYNVPIALTAGSVPEASTWAMLMIGFSGLGLAAFRTNRQIRTIVASTPQSPPQALKACRNAVQLYVSFNLRKF